MTRARLGNVFAGRGSVGKGGDQNMAGKPTWPSGGATWFLGFLLVSVAKPPAPKNLHHLLLRGVCFGRYLPNCAHL